MINNISESQLAYLETKGKFTIPYQYDTFPENVIELLKKYGHLYQALSNGTLSPINKEQEQFIEVAHMRRAPQTDHELAWLYCVKRKKWEAEHGSASHATSLSMDDTFHNRDMAKNDKNSVYNIRKKKDEE